MKRIIVCIDGTGNTPEFGPQTNVYKLFSCLKNYDKQVAYYHPGIGTVDTDINNPLKPSWFRQIVLEQGFGWGIWGIIKDVYTFLSQVYEKGDKIILLGFSRGSFCCRLVEQLILEYGILTKYNMHMFEHLVQLKQKNKCSEQFNSNFSTAVPQIECMALFDCVETVGLIYGRTLQKLSYTNSIERIKKVYHAVSIHEKRRAFKPHLFDNRGHILQEWFPGVHADVGGGYKECGLADNAMIWMIKNLQKHKVQFWKSSLLFMETKGDLELLQHESYKGAWKLFGKYVRKIPIDNKTNEKMSLHNFVSNIYPSRIQSMSFNTPLHEIYK